ncbi:HIT domain-containing protein [Kordiimonas sp.]|uniref:HIT domain-containing protein n=1 Tax=Kordiimonas sp. TaxID=1970157 RepID=UPI003A933395
MTTFHLHKQLAMDTEYVCTLSLCRVLLVNDSNYPWLILVPERADMREIHDLAEGDQIELMGEITLVSRMLQTALEADKMNIAALGNMVSQLHVHVIARYEGDPAWPGPVWGKVSAEPYEAEVLEARLEHLRAHLADMSL